MNDQEKAREELHKLAIKAYTADDEDRPMGRVTVDAVLSADPRVIAEANDWEVRTEQGFYDADGRLWWNLAPVDDGEEERTVIVLLPRKVKP